VYSEKTATARGVTSEKFKINNNPKTFIDDATRLWKTALQSIKMAKSLEIFEKEAKKFCKSLPI
jgi:hypothetical protein